MRIITFCLVGLSACFGIPTYQDGILECDNGQCPPDMECRADNRCYRIGAQPDAPLGTVDAPPMDGPIIDAPISPFDAPLCTAGQTRCAAGNVETCEGGVWTPAAPSCASMSKQCFDPAPEGGNDAYCGTCLKGAQRCSSTSPPDRQMCVTGDWELGQTCDATFGCFDLDGETGPQAYCGVCQNGNKRCNGGLQTCGQGLWSAPVDCTMTSGWTCFDPSPAGGTDAYCGLCLKNTATCVGSDRQVCNAQGTGITTTPCPNGCNPATATCCSSPPNCTGRVCGESLPNACGRTIDCGTCSGGPTKCCGGTICCNAFSCCDGSGGCGACP